MEIRVSGYRAVPARQDIGFETLSGLNSFSIFPDVKILGNLTVFLNFCQN